jgi:mono/diheme cytochrome c family protein
MNKLLLGLFSMGLVFFACSGNESTEKDALAGETVFKQYCIACHGADGKLGINNAKDLTASVMPLKDRIHQITEGKAGTAMTPFKSMLSEAEIKQVAAYTMKLSGK